MLLCTSVWFLENCSSLCHCRELSEILGESKQTFTKLRYTRDGGSSNDLQELGRVAIHSPTTQAMTGANFGDKIDTFNPFLPATGAQFVKTETERKIESFECNDPFACEDEAGFTAEELSEMETSGSSDVTSLTEPKEEEYDWSQYTSFEYLPFEDSQMECESSQRLENYANSPFFWNLFPNGGGSNDGIDFISNVLEELPILRDTTSLLSASS